MSIISNGILRSLSLRQLSRALVSETKFIIIKGKRFTLTNDEFLFNPHWYADNDEELKERFLEEILNRGVNFEINSDNYKKIKKILNKRKK